MPSYVCEYCHFNSKLKGDYNRHLKTLKHLRNEGISLQFMVMSQNEPQKSQNEPLMSQNEPLMSQEVTKFHCDYCEIYFKTHANKRKHEIHRCKENLPCSSFLELLRPVK